MITLDAYSQIKAGSEFYETMEHCVYLSPGSCLVDRLRWHDTAGKWPLGIPQDLLGDDP